MGMPVRLVLYAPDGEGASAARRAFRAIATLEDVMSDYRPASELRRLPATYGRCTPVSEPLFAVLGTALTVARATDGAFDPTVGTLVALWREARRTARLPSRAAIADARRRVGWRHVALDAPRRCVRLARAGMRLDLGGVAKGFILQAALDTLRAHGVSRALLEAGGDIVVGDPPPGRRGWHVDAPGADAAVRERAAALANAAIATSGPTAQFVEIAGVRYSHVVDPRTGVGLTTGAVATVVADHGATADALATALTVLEPSRRAAALARFPAAVASVHQYLPLREEPGGDR
jgi:thiamine biosynthesis lipoprotein